MLYRQGQHSGYCLRCRHHQNCKRDLTFGKDNSLSQEEAQARLLAWEADGADVDKAEHTRRVEILGLALIRQLHVSVTRAHLEVPLSQLCISSQ